MVRSIFSNWVGLLAIGLMSLLITPLMIHRLGELEFGIYTLAFSTVGYFDLLARGIRLSLQRFVGRLSDPQDREALNSMFSTALAVSLVMGIFLTLLFSGLSRVLPSFFKLGPEQQHLFARLLFLVGLNLGLGIPAALLGSYLCGLHRFDLYNLLTIFRQGVRTILIFLVLLDGRGVLAVAGCVLVSAMIALPLNWWMIRRIDSAIKFQTRLVRLQTARQLLSFGFWALLNEAGQLLRDSTDSMVIGRVLNAALITPFTVASQIVGYFRPIITSIVSPALPWFSQLDSQSQHEEIRRFFIRLTRLSAVISLSIGSMIILHGRTLLLLWVGPRYVSSYHILVLLTIGAVASAAQLATLYVLVAKGRHRAYGIWTLSEGLVNLFLSVIWARQYGIFGVSLGTAVPLLALKLTVQPWYVTRVLGLSLTEYFGKALGRPLVVCGLFVGLCGLISGFQANGNVLHLLVTFSWQGPALLILAYTVGLERLDRQSLRLRFPAVAQMLPLC